MVRYKKNFSILWRNTTITAADALIEKGFATTLLKIMEEAEYPEIIEIHLEILKNIMYDCGKCIALKANGFNTIVSLHNANVTLTNYFLGESAKSSK